MTKTLFGWAIISMIGVASTAACSVPSPRVPLDPAANFTAHLESRGIVVDRMAHGERATLVANGGFFSHKPPFVVEEGDKDVAAVWRDGSEMIVRAAATNGEGAPIGDVKSDRRDGAIRLTFDADDHGVYRTSAFHRASPWRTPALLGQPAENILDLPGVYVAEVRNVEGAPVGWMRVEISRYGWPTRRLYDGSLPASINGPLAVAAVKRLDSEINWVEQHATDPYIGN